MDQSMYKEKVYKYNTHNHIVNDSLSAECLQLNHLVFCIETLRHFELYVYFQSLHQVRISCNITLYPRNAPNIYSEN
jgi:hypothetical protein